METAQKRLPNWALMTIWVLSTVGLVLIVPFTPAHDPFKEGGWGMYPILVIMTIALIIVCDSTVFLLRTSFDSRDFMSQLGDMLRSGNYNGAVQLCASNNKPLSRIIGAGVSRSEQGESWVLRAMDESAYGELPVIEKRTSYLALLGNVATLAGLLGTITGLIKSFGGVSQESTADKATLLAAGISEAMNCTAFGLGVGIVSLLGFSVLNGWTQGLLDNINLLSLRAFRSWKATKTTGNEPHVHKPIHAPGPHLRSYVGLGKGKHGLTGGSHGKKSTFASLQLTPMIDMFIVVLIFLLMTFQAEGQILSVSRDIKLPFAEKVDKLARAPIVAVSYPENDPAGGVITLEGSEVSTARELLEDESPDWKIAKLTEQLEVKKHNWKITNPDKQFPGEVIVQCDQNVDFKIIKKVMYSCGLAGYSNVHFAVTQKVARAGEH
jgi:biopolymer transport protein ExbB/TolQ/biopolymer transport protein ExbD